VRQLHKTVHSVAQLEEEIRKLKVLHAYNSIGYYLNPISVSFNDFEGKKAGWQVSDNILIGSDLVFDIDARDRTLIRAKRDAIVCYDWLREKGYEAFTVFSGRGFHIRVTKHDLNPKLEHPQDRLKEHRRVRQPLVDELRKLGVEFDAEVTLNPKGIIRLIGSVHGLTGHVVSRVDDLDGFDVRDVERLPFETSSSPATPKRRMTAVVSAQEPSATAQLDSGCPHVRSPTIFPYISTRINGTKNRHALLLRFPLTASKAEIKRKLNRLLRDEALAPFVMFQSNSAYFAFSPSAVEIEHIPRLLKCLPEGRAAYSKFHRRLLPLPVHFIGKVGKNNPRAMVSRSHITHLRYAYGLRIQGVPCGNVLLPFGVAGLRS
jgi:hypothetical protein